MVAALAGWAVFIAGRDVARLGTVTLGALWLLPALMSWNLLQLWLSALAWRPLVRPPLSLGLLFSLRIVREGIDSLLPVAQVGGELVGAQLAARYGPKLTDTAASVVVDVTLEFLSQLVFLVLGLACLSSRAGDGWRNWTGAALLAAVSLAGFLAAQRLGLLRVLEALARQIAARWPGAVLLTGLHAAVAGLYQRRGLLLRSAGLHFAAWLLGTVETWAILHALGLRSGLLAALVVESLGMAARSAGFAIPGALVVQEAGFALAAAAAGLPREAGLSVSLVKRVREVAIGLIGLLLWRLQLRRHHTRQTAGNGSQVNSTK